MPLSAKHGYGTTGMRYEWVHDRKVPPLETRTVGVLAQPLEFSEGAKKEQGIAERRPRG